MVSASELVRHTRSRPAFVAALANPDLRHASLSSEHLPEDLFIDAYRNKPKPLAVKVAQSMVEHELSPAQLDHVLTTETRVTIVKTALTFSNPSSAQLLRLVDQPYFTAEFAEHLMKPRNDNPVELTAEWYAAAAAKVGGVVRLQYWLVAHAHASVSDAEVAEGLLTYTSWGPKYDGGRLKAIIAARPGIISAAARSDSSRVRLAAAGSRFLTDEADQRACAYLDEAEFTTTQLDERQWVWMAFAHNPVVPPAMVDAVDVLLERLDKANDKRDAAKVRRRGHPDHVDVPFEQVSNREHLNWLLKRVLPYNASNSTSDYRAEDAPALLANPHLSEGDVRDICAKLGSYIHLLTPDEVFEPLLDLLRKFPNVANDYSLTPDALIEARHDWEGRADRTFDAYDTLVEKIPTQDECAAAAIKTVTGSYYLNEKAWSYLDHTLTEPMQWAFVYTMLTTGDFPGTVFELAGVATSMA